MRRKLWKKAVAHVSDKLQAFRVHNVKAAERGIEVQDVVIIFRIRRFFLRLNSRKMYVKWNRLFKELKFLGIRMFQLR